MENEEHKSQLVIQHNDLIRAVAKMDRMPLKLFEIIVGSYNDRKNKDTVYIKKQLVYDLLDIKGTSRANRLRSVIRELHTHAIFSFRTVDNDEYSIAPIQEIMWNNAKPEIRVIFAPKLLPYISMLQNNFTQYKLTEVAKLNSKHAITLYKLVAMNYNQYKYYATYSQKKRSREQVDEYANPVITVKELKYLTQTEDKYKSRFSSFERLVLKKPLEEINKNTDFTVTYDKVKHGRKIYAIQFHISRNGEVLEIKQDIDEAQYQKALNSPYTIKLVSAKILNMVNLMKDKELVVTLAKEVYPVYRAMVKRYDEKALQQHLTYLKTRINKEVIEKSLAKYLKKAAENRLEQLGNNRPPRIGRNEEMPEWAGKTEEQLNKKASQEEVDALKKRIADRNKK